MSKFAGKEIITAYEVCADGIDVSRNSSGQLFFLIRKPRGEALVQLARMNTNDLLVKTDSKNLISLKEDIEAAIDNWGL